jgi:hypothetical protein
MDRAHRIITAAILLLVSSSWNPPASTAITPAGQLQETWKQIVVILSPDNRAIMFRSARSHHEKRQQGWHVRLVSQHPEVTIELLKVGM